MAYGEEELLRYQPGVCNIGLYNVRLRTAFGLFFIIISFALAAAIPSAILKAFLVVPLYAGFLGLYQAKLKFCVHHAKKRTYDMR